MDLAILFNCLLLAVWVRVAISEHSSEENDSSLVVIDTDGAIDDCETMLLVLANQDKTKLLAMTCLYGVTDVDNACDNALRVLLLANKQGIPVHKGSSGPLSTEIFVSEFGDSYGIDGLANRSLEFPTGDQELSGTSAALALSQLARTHPGSITVLAIGPLTNLALAHRIDPDFTHFLKEIVIVGGDYNGIVTDSAQYNFKVDPLAANIILTEAGCPLIIVPFQTATKYGIPWDKYQELIQIDTPQGDFFQTVTEHWRDSKYDMGGATYFVYDSLAAAIVLRPEIVTSEENSTLAVEYQGGLTKGVTVVLPDHRWRPPARIITELNTELNGTDVLFELYREMLVGSISAFVEIVVRGEILEGSAAGKSLIVIDTDGGIDDSDAMLLVLTSQDRAHLLAMTCVFGDTDVDTACSNALRVLVLADGQGIPVHKGSSGPIRTGIYVPELGYYIGTDGLGNRSLEFPTGGQKLSGTRAALALSQLARKYPGSITLLAIGPLTNLALAHRIDPEFTIFLKEIVILGGNYNGILKNPVEFNFKVDPLAANIILTEAACPLTIVPFETSGKNGIPWDRYPELTRIDTTLGRFFRRVTEVQSVREHARGDPSYIVYDFVAAAVVIHPEIVTSEVKKTLSVEYEGKLTQGATVVLPDQTWRKPARIVTNVNGTAIFELFQKMLIGS